MSYSIKCQIILDYINVLVSFHCFLGLSQNKTEKRLSVLVTFLIIEFYEQNLQSAYANYTCQFRLIVYIFLYIVVKSGLNKS